VVDERTLSENWRSKNAQAVDRFESSRNRSTAVARLQFVRIANAAKVGMIGIVRPLLMMGAYDELFKCAAIAMTINYKWEKKWKHRFWWMAAFYALFLMLFTAFGAVLAKSGNLSLESEKTWGLSVLLSAIWLCGIRMGYKEYMQIKTSIKDRKDHFGSRRVGLKYFLLQSKWNWVNFI